MRIEIVIFLITSLIVANIYTEGKYIARVLSAKKYLQMGGVVLSAMFLYFLIKKNPANAKNIIMTSNEYIKYLPIDKNSADFISPILDFTTKSVYPMSNSTSIEDRVMSSGNKTTKRSVSETKKKYVASRQNWHCGSCNKQLTAWFEVDHKIRLDQGGSNHIDNLLALCRECHGEKTTIENL